MDTNCVVANSPQPESLSDLWRRMRRQLGLNVDIDDPSDDEEEGEDSGEFDA